MMQDNGQTNAGDTASNERCRSSSGCSGSNLADTAHDEAAPAKLVYPESCVIPFPVSTSCSGRTMPGLTTPELRQRAKDNYYTAERRAGTDPLTAFDRAEVFAADLERIAEIMRKA